MMRFIILKRNIIISKFPNTCGQSISETDDSDTDSRCFPFRCFIIGWVGNKFEIVYDMINWNKEIRNLFSNYNCSAAASKLKVSR